MRSITTRLVLSCSIGTALLAGTVSAADAPVTVAVRPTILFAGGDVRATVRTPRDARNRELRVSIDASEFYASSNVQLDGADAAATHQFTWKSLPGGAYRVEATLTREDGRTESFSSCFAVISGEEGEAGTAARRTPPPAGTPSGSC